MAGALFGCSVPNLHVEDFEGFNVVVADGFTMTCTKHVSQLSIALGNHTMTDEFYVVGIGNTNVVLDDLYPLFDQYGKVVDIFIPRNRRTGDYRGFAFVCYKYAEEAKKAIERLDGSETFGASHCFQVLHLTSVLEIFPANKELRSTKSAAKFNQRLVPVKCSDLVTDKGIPSRPVDAEYVPSNFSMDLVTSAVNAIFSYKPFYNFASKKAREMIIKRGTDIGHPWEAELAQLRLHDWETELRAVQNQDIVYPGYYLKPFHAYEKGNLSWQAALEVELAAKSVHANIFDPERKKLDPEGDSKLRLGYHEKICSMIKKTPKEIVDFGCATGLSTFGLHQVFPGADIVGVDLSPYFLSVANFFLKEKSKDSYLPIQFLHAMNEDTGLPSHSFDLVSLSSVCHELPRSVTEQVIDEANRLLKPGGVLCIMEMNPRSPLVQKMVNNVFAFTAFKATEPYFDDYRTFAIEKAIEERGFTFPVQADNSPRHRTIVAHKR